MDGQIVVTTEALRAQSDEVSRLITNTQNSFSELKKLVSGTDAYWIGEAGEVHRKQYTQKESTIDTAIRRLREHVTDLRAMAGIYDTAEDKARGQAQSLISEVIS